VSDATPWLPRGQEDLRYRDGVILEAAQALAEAEGLGVWSGGCPAAPACDPRYPGVCIPPPPPDLDCGDIPFRRFTVLPPDPHRFDGDGDGIGCESG
jgi:micrococcal nuclease